MQVVIEGAARDIPELATDGRNAARPIGHEVLGIAQLVDGHDPRPATFSTPCSRRENAFFDALADEVALHLGKSGLDLQEGPAGGCGRVHRRIDGLEPDTALLESIDQGNEVVRQPSETVEIQHDQDIVATQMIEAGDQAGARRIGP